MVVPWGAPVGQPKSKNSVACCLSTRQKPADARKKNPAIEMRRARIPWARSVGDVRQAVMEIMATLAKQERVKRSGRTKAGLARARAAGKALGLSKDAQRPAHSQDCSAKRTGPFPEGHQPRAWCFRSFRLPAGYEINVEISEFTGPAPAASSGAVFSFFGPRDRRSFLPCWYCQVRA